MNITTVPALLGIFALAFLLLLMAKVIKQPAEDRTAKQLLLLLLVGLIAMTFCLFYIYARMSQDWPRLATVEIGFAYWIGPSLYFYVRRLTGGQSPFVSPLNLLHWVPAILIELALLPFFLMPLPEKVAYLQHPSGLYARMIGLTWAGFQVQLLFYILLCQPYLRIYRQRMADGHSRRSSLAATALLRVHRGDSGRVGHAVTENYAGLVLHGGHGGVPVHHHVGVLRAGAKQAALRHGGAAAAEHGHSAGHGQVSALGAADDSARYYLDKLSRLMATERCYLEGDLSLKSLADRVKISPHHLSQLLNDKLHKNFYDYVNEQRVEHAKRSLSKDPQRSITEIAFGSGYNSKNSFYNAFKRHTGTMPSDFRRRHRRAESPGTPPQDTSPPR